MTKNEREYMMRLERECAALRARVADVETQRDAIRDAATAALAEWAMCEGIEECPYCHGHDGHVEDVNGPCPVGRVWDLARVSELEVTPAAAFPLASNVVHLTRDDVVRLGGHAAVGTPVSPFIKRPT